MSYKIQIDDEVRTATTEESARIDAFRAECATIEAVKEAQAIAAASGRAKLTALGLTEAEVAALLGG